MSKIFLLYANKTKFYFFSEGPLEDLVNATGELGISVIFSQQIFTLNANIAKFYSIGLY